MSPSPSDSDPLRFSSSREEGAEVSELEGTEESCEGGMNVSSSESESILRDLEAYFEDLKHLLSLPLA